MPELFELAVENFRLGGRRNSGKPGEENENCSSDPRNPPYDARIVCHAGGGNQEDKDQK